MRLELSASRLTLDGQELTPKPGALKASFEQVTVPTIDIHAADDTPAGLVIEALTTKLPDSVKTRRFTWQDITLTVTNPHAVNHRAGTPHPASLFSWRANRVTQLWSISEDASPNNLGPFEPGDAKAEPGVIAGFRRACQPHGCRFELELREETLQAQLRTWQRIIRAVDSDVELHALAPLPPKTTSRDVGDLPPEVIQAVVRLTFDTFRVCYEDGLGRNPELQGRISVRFIIERDGSVKTSTESASDLPDPAVRDCVVKRFLNLKFPPPESGIVTVVYPIMLAPG